MENSRFHHQSLIGNFNMNKLVLSAFFTLAILMAQLPSSLGGRYWWRSTDDQVNGESRQTRSPYRYGYRPYRSTDDQETVQVSMQSI